MIESVEALLGPYDPALLDAAMLRRQRLHLHSGQAERFAALLPWSVFNTLPSVEGLNNAELRILQKGRNVPYDMLVLPQRDGQRRRLAPEKVQNIAHQGVSVVVNQVQKRIPAIAALNAMLERRYRCEVSTNCYASFSRDGALPPHRDNHDVIVLQLQGEKRWLFHGAEMGDPSDPGFAASLPPPEAEILLQPGDLLFVPRGDVHHAEVVGGDSLHLSIGLQHARGGDVLRWLADLADVDGVGGEPILPMETSPEREERRSRLQAMVAALAEGLDLDAFFAARDQARVPSLPMNLGLSGRVTDATLVLPSARTRLPAEGLGAIEEEVMAHLLEHDGVRVAILRTALPQHDAATLGDAIASLARKGRVFLGD